MTMPVISIIGAGNMGRSLISGLIKNHHLPHHLIASNPTREKLHDLEEVFHIHTTTNNLEAAEKSDVIIFAIKPQILLRVAKELASSIQKRKPLVISVAVGISEKEICKSLGGYRTIIRAMPNISVLIGDGATALYANQEVNEEKRHLAESILRSVGLVVWLDQESQMDVVTALSGCGPAYFFLVMEALQKAAEEFGLAYETAHLLTLQTALGAARLAMESKQSLQELRQKVTSPGGSTEKALAVLEKNNICDIFKQALYAAKERACELAKTVL